MLRYLFLTFTLAIYTVYASAQSGCTDPQATNYNPSATTNDGSCIYATTTTSINSPKDLPAALNENSGLAYTDGKLWTFNDGGNAPALYRISESNGSILQTVTISNATNVDWEDMTADANYLYIGDFGNNANGNRTDLKIYRISKAAIGNAASVSVTADVINFSYSDQDPTNMPPTGNNNTEFDCEAFLIKDNQLHLFTKDWVGANGYYTKHYTLPAVPGTYIAQYQSQYLVNGLITGADISTTNINEIVLIGYDVNNASLFMWLLFDYTGNNFFSGNKRRIGLGNAINYGQIEGVTYTSDLTGYISSERFSAFIFNVPPRLYTFSTSTWIPLPVELINFTANLTDQGVLLSWQTASETNSHAFIVERSENGIDFQEIGRLQAAVNSMLIKNYQFTDNQPSEGINYYRLKQTDLDSTFSYSQIRSVQTTSGKAVLVVSPVPVRQGESIHIQFKGEIISSAALTLRSMNGKVLMEESLSFANQTSAALDTHQLRPGMYLLQIVSPSGLYMAKVMVY